ncbi:MAG: winged helix-turn-helix transcriptional regulator, partial [Silvibacterium sp.]
DKATSERLARDNGNPELRPDGNTRLNKLGTRPDLSPDRRNSVRTREKKKPSVPRIEGKWAFRILSELEHGSAQLSELCVSLHPASGKTLRQHLRQLEKAGLIVHIRRTHKMPKLEYSLSDPLGIAAVHLINALIQSGGGQTSE